MTDDDRRHEQLRRRLADEGRATAPPDLAPEVMRRVRSEPRRRERRYLRPAATLIAAAALAGAAALGISHLGGAGSSSGSGSLGALAGGASRSQSAKSPQTSDSSAPSATGGARKSLLVRHVASQRLGPIFGLAAVPPCPTGARLSVLVPAPQLHRVASRLRYAAAGTVAEADTRDVELHRAPKGQTRIRVTCP